MRYTTFLFSAIIGFALLSSNSYAQGSNGKIGLQLSDAKYRAVNLSFNSPNSDFGIFPYSSSMLFFSSNRENENSTNASKAYNYNNLPFLDLYTISKTGDTSYSSPFVLSGNKETKFNEGPVFYDATSSTFFITRNQYDKKKNQQSRYGENKLRIYMENIDGTTFKSFGEFQYNNTAYSVGHAAVSPDGSKIYFSSDMPGGLGGSDLYVCTKEGQLWGAPKNLGPAVNTAGSEVFPFVSEDNKLYFSTNGRSTTTGLDIYSAELAGEEYKNLKNLGAPFNSDKDDFSFYVCPGNKTGFFSSNRPGGKGDDDIYSFELDNPMIKGVVLDEKSNRLPFAKIKIMDDDLKVVELAADSAGGFNYEAKWGNDYTLIASKDGFTNISKSVTTGKGSKTIFDVDFKLVKEEYGLEGAVLNKDNNAGVARANVSLVDKASGKISTAVSDDKGMFHFNVKPNLEYLIRVEKTKFVTSSVPVSTKGMAIGVKKQNVMMEELVVGKSIKIDNVYYDQGKWDIRADAKPELDKMVTLMNENPSMEVELSSHTDARGSDASNLSLSDKRAKSVVSYIVSKGISPSRLVAKGYGETKLLNACGNGKKCSDAEHQTNRRTEFKILKM